MENLDGSLAFLSTLDIKDFEVGADEMEARVRSLSLTTQQQSQMMEQSLLGFAQRGADYIKTFLVGAGMKNLLMSIVRTRGQFQDLQTAFETMLGSSTKAEALMQQMVKTAATTPFDLQGVASGAKQLLAYGESAETVNDTLIRLGNIASGLSIPLNDIVYLYGTTMVQGRLYAQDVRQFTGRGIPLVKELAKEYGVTTDKINEMVSAGKIGFPDVEKVIKKMTDQGGQFYNLMEKQSHNLNGMIANLGDAWDSALNRIGQSQEGVFNDAIQLTTDLVEHMDDILKVVKAVAIAYGSYRAALVLNTLATKGYTGVALIDNTVHQAKIALLNMEASLNGTNAAQQAAMTAAENAHTSSLLAQLTVEEQAQLTRTLKIAAINEILTVQQQQYLSNLNLASSSQAYLEAATSVLTVEQRAALQKVDLSEKSAVFRSALEQEVAAKQASAAATLESMRAETKAAYARMQSAKQSAVAAAQAVESARYELYWAQKSGEQSKILVAQKKLETAEDNATAARKAALASATQFYTTKKELEATASKATAAATATDTAAKAANTAATAIATTSTNLFTGAVKKLWIAFKANPLGWVLTIVGLVVSAFEMFKSKTDDATESTDAVANASKKATDEFNQQAAHIEMLNSVVHDQNRSNEDRKNALNELKKIIPGYNAMLTDEGNIIRDNTVAIKEYLVQLQKQIMLKAGQDQLEALYKKRLEIQQRINDINDKEKNGGYLTETTTPRPVTSGGGGGGAAAAAGDAASARERARNQAAAERRQANADMADVNGQINKLNKSIEDTSNQLGATSKKGSQATKTFSQQVTEVRNNISALQRDIAKARAGKVKNGDLASYISEKEKELSDQQARLAALTGQKGGKGGGTGRTGARTYTTTTKNEDKKTFDEILSYYKQQYTLYNQWSNNVGKDVADKHFSSLIKSGTSFIEWVNNHIAALEAKGGKRTDEENSQLNSLIEQRNEIMGVKSAMDTFKESVEQSISSAETLAEKIQAIADAKQRLKDSNMNADDKAATAQFIVGKEEDVNKDVQRMVNTYQTLADKRKAIEKKYNDDISVMEAERQKASQKGDEATANMLTARIAQAQHDKGKELMNNDLEVLKNNPDYIKAFEDLSTVSTETLEHLKAEFENAKESAATSLNPEDLREYTNTIQQLSDEITSRDPFGTLKQKQKELEQADQELAQAEAELREVQNRRVVKLEDEQRAEEKVRKAKDKQIKKNREYKAAEKTVTSQIKKLCDQLSEVGNTVGGTAGEIISLIGDIGSFTMSAIEGFQTASEASSKAIQTLERASVILTIISAAWQITQKIYSLIGGDGGEAEYEKAKKMYEAYCDTLDDVIDKQKELVASLDSENARNSYKYAKSLVESQEEAARSLGKQYLNAGAKKGVLGIGSSSSHGVSQRKGISSEGWAQLQEWATQNKITQSILDSIRNGRMTGLFDLTLEQIQTLKEQAPVFFANLDEDTRTYLNDILKGGDSIKELEDSLKENITGISFDSLSDDFLGALQDMEGNAEDAAANISKTLTQDMRKAIISEMYKKEFKDQLQKWYDMWAEAMGAESEGGTEITEDEQAALDTLKNSIISGATQATEAINKQFGGVDATDATSLEGAVSSMSEQTSGVIAGRLNAVIINQADGLQVTRQILLYQASIAHFSEVTYNEVSALRSFLTDKLNNGSLLSQGIS
jgi:tape measure domain-containing protein